MEDDIPLRGGGGRGETAEVTKVDTVSSSLDFPIDSSTVSSSAGTCSSPESFSPSSSSSSASSSSFLHRTQEENVGGKLHAVPRLRRTEAAEGWNAATDEDSLLFVSSSPLQTHRSFPSRTTSNAGNRNKRQAQQLHTPHFFFRIYLASLKFSTSFRHSLGTDTHLYLYISIYFRVYIYIYIYT